jgi:Uma2 family endonuclease
MATLDRATSLEDLYALPADGRRYELQGGLLVSEPLPSPLHGQVTATVIYELERFVRPRKLGVVLTADAGFILARDPDTLGGPDAAFVSRERWERLPDTRRPIEGAPDLAVEVVSPGNSPGEMRAKVAEYLAAGARLVWVVDPEQRSVTTYAELLSPRRLGDGDELDAEDVLPGFRVAVDALWSV